MDKRCRHCLGDIVDEYAITDEEGNLFCCNGCLGVYNILKGEGLEDFYKKRMGWRPGVPDFVDVDEEMFQHTIKKDNFYSVLELTISGIRCASCIWLIERHLKRVDGIVDVRLNYATYGARIVFKREDVSLKEILRRITELGYVPRPAISGRVLEISKEEARGLLIRFGTGAFFSMQIMLLSVALYAGYFQGMAPGYKRVFQLISLALATPVLFYAGYPFIKGTLSTLKRGYLGMDTLITLGAMSAYLFSIVMIVREGETYFDSAAMIITIILLGRYIETVSRSRASRVVSMLAELVPSTVRVVTSGESKKIPIDRVRKGDLVQILAGERIAVDGIVVEGNTEVDESMLTGEARPVIKQRGDEVYAATINTLNPIKVEVKAAGKETVLYNIIKTVENAQERQAPVQRIADRVSHYFVLFITLLGSMTFIYWFNIMSVETALINTISVLVVACPCALGLATPLAILIGSQRASSSGIIIKGGDIIERLSKVTHILLDKTGTITRGEFFLEDAIFYGEGDKLRMITSKMEALSNHPVSRALISAQDLTEDMEIKDHKVIPGRGISAVVKGKPCFIGNLEMINEAGIDVTEDILTLYKEMTSKGKVVVFLVIDGKIEGLYILSDKLRENASMLVKELRDMGLVSIMVSGDTKDVVREVAKGIGIEKWYSSLSPTEKAGLIKGLKDKGFKVMMVGDGINDAPALVEADVGMSFGRATDISLESADVVITRPDLLLIKDALELSKRVMMIIKENLFWAFSYNILTVPLAMAGKIHPILSAIFMVISSLVVVGNSLRLR